MDLSEPVQHTAMWHFISEQISQATARPFVCQRVTPVAGGDSHQSVCVRDDRQRYFVKLRPATGPAQLVHEADGLKALAATDTVHCPTVICHGLCQQNDAPIEYLVLSYLRFDSRHTNWPQLAAQVAALHQAPQPQSFGWSQDNFIGLSPQTNTTYEHWPAFFAEQRIGAMAEKLARDGLAVAEPDTLVDQTRTILNGHTPAVSLVHGDLWAGNVGFCSHGPVVFDPAVHRADRETDLAMTELFGRLPETFYEHYQQVYPLPEDYPQRRLVYQLYHILNHALLFGGQYQDMAKSTISRIQQQL